VTSSKAEDSIGHFYCLPQKNHNFSVRAINFICDKKRGSILSGKPAWKWKAMEGNGMQWKASRMRGDKIYTGGGICERNNG
jgi:hypothetical protein